LFSYQLLAITTTTTHQHLPCYAIKLTGRTNLCSYRERNILCRPTSASQAHATHAHAQFPSVVGARDVMSHQYPPLPPLPLPRPTSSKTRPRRVSFAIPPKEHDDRVHHLSPFLSPPDLVHLKQRPHRPNQNSKTPETHPQPSAVPPPLSRAPHPTLQARMHAILPIVLSAPLVRVA